jgi:hypothetical protein
MDGRELELIERGVVALEKMVGGEPTIEWEPGPPICPACGSFNPLVTLPANLSMTGKLGEVYLEFRCEDCKGQIFAVIESYSMHQAIETTRAEIENRKERIYGNNGTPAST